MIQFWQNWNKLTTILTELTMSTLLTVLTLLLMLVITLNTVEPIWNSIRHYLTKSQKHHSLTGSPILWIKRMLKRVDGISGSRSFAKDCLFTLVKSRLALGSPGWLFVRLSPCRKWPNTQENGCYCPLVITSKVKLFFRPGERNEWSSQSFA